MATLFVVAFLAEVFSAGAFLAAEPAVDAAFFAEVFVAGVVFAGALRAVFFFGSPDAEALFLAAAERWGADFFRADVAMTATPCLSRRLKRTGRKTVGHVPTTGQSDAQTVDIR
jgi:hypothetical protein